MSQKSIITFFGSVLIIAVVAGFVGYKMQPGLSPVPSEISSVGEPQTSLTSVDSPDGKMIATLDETIQSSGNTILSVTVQDAEKSEEAVTILKSAYPAGTKLVLPKNAWSPNNRYLFLKEEGGTGSSFFVFNSNGEPFSETSEYIDVVSGFTSKNTGFELRDVTGWDSNTLLHIKAANKEGSRANFWFEIPSSSVIRLSH